jgi:hypothetical protein
LNICGSQRPPLWFLQVDDADRGFPDFQQLILIPDTDQKFGKTATPCLANEQRIRLCQVDFSIWRRGHGKNIGLKQELINWSG